MRKPHQSSYVCDDYSDESVMNNWFLAKALELFLGMIIEEAYKVTAERGSKKVEAYHLCVVLASIWYSIYECSTLHPSKESTPSRRQKRWTSSRRSSKLCQTHQLVARST